MGLAVSIARRSLVGRPGRTLFSILGVAVGIATVVAVFTLDHVTVLSRTRALEPDWGADLEVRPSGGLEDPRAELLRMEGVAGVAAFFQNDVQFRPVAASGEEDRSVRIRMVALEEGSGPSLGVYHVEEGADIRADGARKSCLVGRKLAREFGLEVGDAVYLSPPARAARQACVEGELQDVDRPAGVPAEEAFTVVGVLANEGIGRRSGGSMVVVGYQEGKRLLADVFVEAQFWLRRDDGVDLEVLEADLSRGFAIDRNPKQAIGQMADERAFRNGVRMAGLFALLLGLFVIFHTLSMSLVERVREVGALYALGSTRVQIARVFFVEALVIAAVAGAAGLGGGVLLTKALLARGITTLGVVPRAVEIFEVPWRTVTPLVLLGVGIALLGSVFPILRARGTDIVAALRGEEAGRRAVARGFHVFSTLLLVAVAPAAFFLVVPVVGATEGRLVGTILIGLSALGLLIGLPLVLPAPFGILTARLARPFESVFPLAGRLAARTLETNPGRIGASVAAIALVTAAFVGLRGMTNSLMGEVEVWGGAAASEKVWVEGLPNVALDELRAVFAEHPEVVGFESGDARTVLSFLLLGLEIDDLAAYGPLAEDPALRRALQEESTILISDRLARQRGLAPGDSVLIQTSGHGVQDFRVVGISDKYGYFPHPDERAYGIVAARHLRRFFCVDTATTTMVAVRVAGSDRGIVEAVVRERFPGATRLHFIDGDSVVGTILEDIRVDFVLFDVILFLTAVLAALGVLNGQLLAALERRKELGILRALGMTRSQVTGAVLLESAVTGGLGGVLGCVVGAGLTPVLVSALRVISGLPLPLRSAGSFLAFALVGALLLAVVAGLYPIWRMNRLDAVRAVRTG